MQGLLVKICRWTFPFFNFGDSNELKNYRPMATFFNRPFDYLPRRSSKTAHQNFANDMSNESSNPYLKLSRFELIGRRDKSQDKLSNRSKNDEKKRHFSMSPIHFLS
uniref:Uncharacterized protein n=1 Tax=Cacopsylla melanoneura TaxID=428564 RepID=A0A8D8L7R7_9HEMI